MATVMAMATATVTATRTGTKAGCRLPAAAEWERAAIGGDKNRLFPPLRPRLEPLQRYLFARLIMTTPA